MATVADELMLSELSEDTRAMLKRLCADGTIYDVLDVVVYEDACPVCESPGGYDGGAGGDYTEVDMVDAYLRGQADAKGQSATTEEKTLALEVATLRRIIGHGTAAHDPRTLRNIQEQRNKIVAAVLRMIDHDDDWGYVRAEILDAAREFRRITGAA